MFCNTCQKQCIHEQTLGEREHCQQLLSDNQVDGRLKFLSDLK